MEFIIVKYGPIHRMQLAGNPEFAPAEKSRWRGNSVQREQLRRRVRTCESIQSWRSSRSCTKLLCGEEKVISPGHWQVRMLTLCFISLYDSKMHEGSLDWRVDELLKSEFIIRFHVTKLHRSWTGQTFEEISSEVLAQDLFQHHATNHNMMSKIIPKSSLRLPSPCLHSNFWQDLLAALSRNRILERCWHQQNENRQLGLDWLTCSQPPLFSPILRIQMRNWM